MARNSIPKIPTADEEALQEPSIDPLFLLASLGAGGLPAALNFAGNSELNNIVSGGKHPLLSNLLALPVLPPGIASGFKTPWSVDPEDEEQVAERGNSVWDFMKKLAPAAMVPSLVNKKNGR